MLSRFPKRVLSFLLLMSILLPLLPAKASASERSLKTLGLEGKTLSILGDSASTFAGISDNTEANSTIGDNVTFYPKDDFDVTADTMWWGQVAKAMGMEILVNNSWSGSCLFHERYGTPGAYLDRCVQLHDDTGEDAGRSPDVIAVFMGANDFYTFPDTVGTFEDIHFDALIRESKVGYRYSIPQTTMEAYAITLHKILHAYPQAEVYCMTIMPRKQSPAETPDINKSIIRLAEYYGVNLVETFYCGINPDRDAFAIHMNDVFHPNSTGMTAVAGSFISSLLQNSKYITKKPLLHNVSFDLNQVVALQGTSWVARDEKSYRVKLVPVYDDPMKVTVTMNGKDITETCYIDGWIYIPSVRGDIHVTADALPPSSLKIAGISLTVASNLAINAKFLQSSVDSGGFTDVYMVYEMNGVREEVHGGELAGGVLSFPFRNILAQWMNDSLTATLYAGYKGHVYRMDQREYSVATYCYNQLRNLENPVYTGEYYAQLRTLLVDLLQYGAAMQTFADYRTDALVSKDLSKKQLSYATRKDRIPESVKDMNYATIPDPTAYVRAVGLELMDSVHLIFVVSLPNPEGYRARIQCKDQEWWIDSENFVYMSGFYRILFDGLYTSQMSDTVLLTLYKGDKVVSNTMSYSIESYIYSMYNNSNRELSQLVRYMLRYGDSAGELVRLSQ